MKNNVLVCVCMVTVCCLFSYNKQIENSILLDSRNLTNTVYINENYTESESNYELLMPLIKDGQPVD